MLMKQDKILKRIYYQNGSGKRIQQAKYNPKDEFYTGYNDILKELNHYGEKFRGKDVICPCDCDILIGKPVYKLVIEFMEEPEPWYISRTGNIYNVKKLTYYTLEDNEYIPTVINGDDARNFISEHIQCNFVKAITAIGEDYGIKSLTASGFDTLKSEGIRFDEVDYSLYDLIITNPPFTQYNTFFNVILPLVSEREHSEKPLDFILLSSYLDRVNPKIGLRLQLGEFYLGYGRHKNLYFTVPTKLNDYKEKTVAVDWITTFPDAQIECDKVFSSTGVDYNLYGDDYCIIDTMTMRDGTHPIRIENKRAIPDNYFGWMFGSCGVLSNLSNSEFEWYITNAKGLYNTRCPEYNPFAHKVTDTMVNGLNGKKGFHGVVFKRKVA